MIYFYKINRTLSGNSDLNGAIPKSIGNLTNLENLLIYIFFYFIYKK